MSASSSSPSSLPAAELVRSLETVPKAEGYEASTGARAIGAVILLALQSANGVFAPDTRVWLSLSPLL